ncbi:MAG: ATP-dependent helicase [Chloroflexi bacterium]|nr:ATP-dependent helicase [Chloroflexota bacterium]
MSQTQGGTLYGYRLRREQREALAYRGGRLAVSAVPGSGKTLTLSLLAARLILEGRIGPRGEVLLVTVQNSAVVNISQRIRQILAAERAPAVGFRVCTLHKLAADILRRRQDLAGVDAEWTIVDEAESSRLVGRAVNTWLAGNRLWWESFLPEPGQGNRAYAEKHWRSETERVGREVTKLCKHLRLTPAAARDLLPAGEDAGFLRMGLDIYDLYAGYLQVRGGLDFDDLIWRAISALEEDETFRSGLRSRWPYLLEDEAQDSSPLQERILDALAGREGNWVRVGDPNQSINSTFTAADPRFFRRFLEQPGVARLTLPQSGRCGRKIMRLANRLVRWTLTTHPEPAIREMAFQDQAMVATEPGDPQENPTDAECWVGVVSKPAADEQAEARDLAGLAARCVAKFPDRTCAILCATRWMGAHVVEALGALDPPVPYDDLLRSTPQTRSVAGLLAAVLGYLARPTQGTALRNLVKALAAAGHLGQGAGETAAQPGFDALVASLRPERLFFPDDVLDIRDAMPPNVPAGGGQVALLALVSERVSRWLRAASLPIDQLLLTVAQDLYEDETLLAICHMLASSLRSTADLHPEWRLRDYAEELDAVAHNRRTIGGLSLTDTGYVDQPGTVVVTTWHKAKGLEWDAVFLMGVDSLEFPSACGDTFRDGPYFMAGRAPAVEARKRLEQLAGAEFCCPEGDSLVEAARLECIAERLRLLYVGITRARRYLVFSYCKARGSRSVQPATPLAVLRQEVARRPADVPREEVERVR